jgi:DNA mismatch repair protein MutS2
MGGDSRQGAGCGTIEQILEYAIDRLELAAVLDEVAAHARSIPGRECVLGSAPVEDPAEFSAGLKLVSELKDVIGVDGELPLGRLLPIRGIFDKLRNPASILEAEELLGLAEILDLADAVSLRVGDLSDSYEAIRRVACGIDALPELRERIGRTFDDHGLVRSSASRRLAEIRDGVASARRAVTRALERIVRDRDMSSIVQEDYITLRNDRCVILLKPEFKGRLEGIAHDRSRSGASVYVEPFEAIELNNRAAELAEQEREETHRIFRELTESVRSVLPQARQTFETLALLDAFQARALYATAIRALAPQLSAEGFRILGGRHPLLIASQERSVVPMDVTQGPETFALVISGPNMGGKTVALKMAGLFPLMVRTSLMIPADEGTEICPFTRIMADIGDEQDLRGRVSSFSGHIMRIKAILEVSEPGDLVLLDELGGATDPGEGAALAMAVLDELTQGRRRVVVTTHLTQLKAYAFSREGVRNVSAEFRPDTMKPTYKLLYDLPGESHAIRAAEAIGLPASVIEAARRYLDPSGQGGADLIAGLRRRLAETELRREELDRKIAELDRTIAETAQERERLTNAFQREAQIMLRAAESELAALMKALKAQGKKPASNPIAQVAEVRRRIETHLGIPTVTENPAARVGALVALKKVGKQGVVSAALEGRRLEVVVGNVKVRADIDDVELVRPVEPQKTSSKNSGVRIEIPSADPLSELNVIGLRVEEALPVVDKALDRAVLAGLSSLTVIHGKGTGRLGQAIREHLERSPYVTGLRAPEARLGGPGVTVVDLRVD